MNDEATEMLGAVFARQLREAAPVDLPEADVELVCGAGAMLMQLMVDGHSATSVDDALASALGKHPWVGDGDGNSPLVYEHGLLYLRRYREAERRLATAIRERVAAGNGSFRIITGGPGTGKTTKVAEIVAGYVDANPEVRIALAAPTGKAAARMGEAIEAAWTRAGRADLLARGQASGTTVHRLLGYLPTSDVFRRTADNPLEHDVVIVDEASMMPLLLMDALVQAVRSDAKLFLLGDHDQLASVEAGSVLADLVRAQDALGGAVERLTHSWRFSAERGIGALAEAIRSGDADAAVRAMHDATGEVSWVATSVDDASWLAAAAGSHVDAAFAAADAPAALEVLERQRILCATNVGRAGSMALTQRVEEELRRRGHRGHGTHYHGRPLLIARNDYALDLFNGDVGVVWEGEAVISTPGREQTQRRVPLPQLPDARTAWAMSVHKSQGSEFDTAIVVLPERDLPILSRELLYTAVTRARKRVLLVGSEAVLRAAVQRTARRGSGLAERLLGDAERAP